eukprot:gnl/Chilomastix_cuspidata/1474.p1 GENE.gnl/Chilomastix_cuspidata/1474~~gnl/Chilomastix_cuspidata/1474.p1  ORF type:complete len:1184 (+),score=326.56 gnl/Chilomastix_cuspidata/1474:150-3701(+)
MDNGSELPSDINERVAEITAQLLKLNAKEPLDYLKKTKEIFNRAFPEGLIPLEKTLSQGIISEIFSVAYFQLSEFKEKKQPFEEFTPFLDLFLLLFIICPEYIPRTFTLHLPSVLNHVLQAHIGHVSPDDYSRFLRVFDSLCCTHDFATRMVNEFHIDRHIAYSTLGLLLQPEPQLASIVEALRLVVRIHAQTPARQISGAQAAGLFEHIFSLEVVRAFDCFEELVSVLFEFLSGVGIDAIPPPICDVFKTLAKSPSMQMQLRVFRCVSNLHSSSFSLTDPSIFENVLTFLKSADECGRAQVFSALAAARYTFESNSRAYVFSRLGAFTAGLIEHSSAPLLKAVCDFLHSLFSSKHANERLMLDPADGSPESPESSTVDSGVPSEELMGSCAFDDRAEVYLPAEVDIAQAPQSHRSSVSGLSFSNNSTSFNTFFPPISDFSMSFQHLLTRNPISAHHLKGRPFQTPTAVATANSRPLLSHQRCKSAPFGCDTRFSPKIPVENPRTETRLAEEEYDAPLEIQASDCPASGCSSDAGCEQFSMTEAVATPMSPKHELFLSSVPLLSEEFVKLDREGEDFVKENLILPIFKRIQELAPCPTHAIHSSFLSLVTAVMKQSDVIAQSDIPQHAVSVIELQLAAGDPNAVTINSIEFISAVLLLPNASEQFLKESNPLVSPALISLVSPSQFLLSELFHGLGTAVAANPKVATCLLNNKTILPFFDVPNIPQNGKEFLNSLLMLKGIAPFLVREDCVKRFLLGSRNFALLEQIQKHARTHGLGDVCEHADPLAQIDEQTLFEYLQFIANASHQPSGAVPASRDELVILGIKRSFRKSHATPSILTQIALHGNRRNHTLPKISSIIFKQFSIIPSLHQTLVSAGIVKDAALYLLGERGSATVKVNILSAYLHIIHANPKLFCKNFRNAPGVFITTLDSPKRQFLRPSLKGLYKLSFVKKELPFILEQAGNIIHDLQKRHSRDLWARPNRRALLLLLHRLARSELTTKKVLHRMEKQNLLDLLLSFPLKKKSPPEEIRLFYELCSSCTPVAAKKIIQSHMVLSKLHGLLTLEPARGDASEFRASLVEFLAAALREDAGLAARQLSPLGPVDPVAVVAALVALAPQSSEATNSQILQILDRLTRSRAARGDEIRAAVAKALAAGGAKAALGSPHARKAQKNLQSRFDLKDVK